jgi:hypothetical protein
MESFWRGRGQEVNMGKRIFTYICLAIVFYPQCLHGSDIFGNFTYRGKVVDADTLQPIQGAVVVAKWYRCARAVQGSYVISARQEARTDAMGNEHHGAGGNWTPPVSSNSRFLVDGQTPIIFVYKPGYYLYGK